MLSRKSLGRLVLALAVLMPAGAYAQETHASLNAVATAASAAPLPPSILQPRSRWVAVPWSELPGLLEDPLFEAWNAWLKSCEKPSAGVGALCAEVRRLSIGSNDEQLAWLQLRFQPYRVEALRGEDAGLLTGYYEPVMQGSRTATPEFNVPLYRPPAGLMPRKPWFTRQEIETLPAAQAALTGRELVFLADPVDALVLQIQGSGRIRLAPPAGAPQGNPLVIRLAFAGTNEQPYKSVGRWLLDQGEIRDGSWPGIKAWVDQNRQNPVRVQDMLRSNPRVVFFKEEALTDADAQTGPRGAQGVPLTAGRSIAVDPASIPYGTPVWLASSGPLLSLQKLVLAQDTGSAITGAVRADYFAGIGPQAGELAGRLKQALKMWVLWPK